jgi:cytoskeletal protein RodZ
MAYIQFDISSYVVYAILYMFEILLALSYVLLPYAFVILILYMWNVESPPERVKDTVNTVASSKGHTNDRSKSNSHTVSRSHKEHHKVD